MTIKETTVPMAETDDDNNNNDNNIFTVELEHTKIIRIYVPCDENDMLNAQRWTAEIKSAAAATTTAAPVPTPVVSSRENGDSSTNTATPMRTNKEAVDAVVPLMSVEPSDGDESVYISIRQQQDGRHEFVALTDVMTSTSYSLLSTFTEEEVKKLLHPRLVYARRRSSSSSSSHTTALLSTIASSTTIATATAAIVDWDHYHDLAPQIGKWTNYSIVPCLCVGRTQVMMLSDEETLCYNSQPTEPIFQHLSLIVNCHQDPPVGRQYKAGSPWNPNSSNNNDNNEPRPPKVIAHAVHHWYGFHEDSRNERNQIIDTINEAIWDALTVGVQIEGEDEDERGTCSSSDGGSVAIHCLAGIHRAACIMACHFLYRYYILDQKHIPCDIKEIYATMMAVRPNVSPAYQHILKSYEKYLIMRKNEREATQQ